MHPSPCARMIKQGLALRRHRPDIRIVLAHQGPAVTDRLCLDEGVFDAQVALPQGELAAWTKAPAALRSIVRTQGIDLIHSHNGPDLLTLAALRSRSVPVVWDIHDMFRFQAPKEFLWSTPKKRIAHLLTAGMYPFGAYRWVERQCARRSAAVITVSEPIAEEARRLGARRVMVAPNFAIDSHPRRAAPGRPGRDRPLELVFQGAVGVAGTHMDRRALMDSVARMPNVRLHLYLVSWNPSHVQGHAAHAQRHANIVLHEPVDSSSIVREMSGYDAGIVAPPALEGNQRHMDSALPNKLFEYWAAGLPVIAPDYRAMREVIDDVGAGVTCPPEALGEGIDRLVENYSRLAERAASLGPRYTWSVQIAHVAALYDSLA